MTENQTMTPPAALVPPGQRAPRRSLDPIQRQAAECGEGPLIITGGPGSGKTYTLVRRMAALLNGGALPATITYITFASKTADLARNELQSLINDEETTKKVFVGTVHSYASAYLRQAGARKVGRTSQYTVWDEDQAKEVLTGLLQQNPGQMTLGQRELNSFRNWEKMNRARYGHVEKTPDEMYWYELQDLYKQEKLRQNVVDLDDLIPLAIEAMEADRHTRVIWSQIRSRHLLVDEYQDITPAQYKLIELMTGPTKSVAIATDPNQSIYRWMGADLELLTRFALDHPNAKRFHLPLNHRSTATLVELSQTMGASEELSGLRGTVQTAVKPTGPTPEIILCEESGSTLVNYVATQAQELHDSEGIAWDEMAIIYREKHWSTQAVMTLRHRRIPHHVSGDPNRTPKEEADRLINLLGCVINPLDASVFASAASTEPPDARTGLNPEWMKDINQRAQRMGRNLIEAAEIEKTNMRDNAKTRENLTYLIAAWRDLTQKTDEDEMSLSELVNAASKHMENSQWGPQRSRALPGVNAGVSQVLALSESKARTEGESLREHLTRFVEDFKSRSRPELTGEEDDPFDIKEGITLISVHASKGHQWKVVWMLDASDNAIPRYVREGDDEAMGEEHRLMYVAATRATERMHFCSAPRTDKDNMPNTTPLLNPVKHLCRTVTVQREVTQESTGNHE